VVILGALLCASATAFAQASNQKNQIDEFVRKAKAEEAADGFCARTNIAASVIAKITALIFGLALAGIPASATHCSQKPALFAGRYCNARQMISPGVRCSMAISISSN
jgi:siroheme synthase